MASSLSLLLLRRRLSLLVRSSPAALLRQPSTPPFSSSSAAAEPSSSTPPSPSSSKPPSLSARLSFVFDQLDALDRSRSSDLSARDAALRRIQSWRRPPSPTPTPDAPSQPEPEPEAQEAPAEEKMSMSEVLRREVELVHPWPEWIELMERLAQHKYFDLSRIDEDRVAAEVPIDLSEVAEVTGLDFSRDWTTVKNACMNFGRDRFDILKSLSRKDLQILVGHGCPSMDPKIVFSAKLLRKLVHLDEGDVCSSCSLRNSCSRGYILTRKEDEARTLDVMRILLVYGFDHVKGTVENKPLLKLKSVKTVVRKLIHEIVKLSAVPIDPNLPPPVIKKPPPKVKQPPPPPKKRVGRDDVEMKKGDWLCPKCDFMNFAKNTICLQCDAKRPKRQLLPGEWECPRCNFLNYRRNMACFHCEHKRPPDEYTDNQIEANQSAPRKRFERPARMSDVSNSWNFDFDDNESDGADVAAFEFADSTNVSESSSVDSMSYTGIARGSEDEGFNMDGVRSEERGRNFSARRDSLNTPRTGFDDFDEDDIDSYELDMSKSSQTSGVSRVSFSELEEASDSEDFTEFDKHRNSKHGSKDGLTVSGDDDDFDDHPSLRASHLADSWQKTRGWARSKNQKGAYLCSDSDNGAISDLDKDIEGGYRYKLTHDRGNPNIAAARHGATACSDDESPTDMGSDIDDWSQLDDRRKRPTENFNDDFPTRGSRLTKRSSRGDHFSRSKGDERSKHFDMHDYERHLDRPRGRANQLGYSSRGPQRNGRRAGDENDRWRNNRNSNFGNQVDNFHDGARPLKRVSRR